MNRPPANLAQLAPNELQALESMRLLFKNEPYPDQQDPNSWFQLEDWTYLRYLRARKFDVPKAELMLKNTLEMRRKYSPHLMSENDPVMRKILDQKSWFLLPPTKQHLAVQFTEAGKLDLSLIETDDEFYRYLVLLSELSIRDLHHRKWAAQHWAAVVDFQHFSLIKSSTPKAIRFSKMLVSVGEMHFPEMLGRVVMFNAPFIFRGTYKLIKPLMAEETQQKILFVTDTTVLDEILPVESRMVRHGGTRTKEYASLYFEE